MSNTTDNTDTATQGYQGSNKPTAGRWTEDAAEEETEKKKGKRRGWIWTCRNNGATEAVADREVRGHDSAPTRDSEVLFFNLCFDDSCRLDSCLGRRQLSSKQGELSEKAALTKTVLFIELAASSRALENTLRAESMQ